MQFFGPLHQTGSPFTPDFFKSDLAGFVTPSQLLLFHSAGSAARRPGTRAVCPSTWPTWAGRCMLVVAVIGCWRQPRCGRPR